MYKNQLQEIAQRSCFNLPSYACIREGPDHAPRFKATVNFNGETFESPTFWSTLRQAEHAAAEVALNELSKKGPSKALAARVLDETGFYKNLLQETAHRAGLKLPVYTTVRSGPGHTPVFSCTVELAGMSFTGELAKTKKQAQKNAAMAAWSALKQLSQSGSSSASSAASLVESGSTDEQEQFTVARYLAGLKPQDTNLSSQRDQQFERLGSAPFRRDAIFPYGGDGLVYPMQWQNWAYSHLSSQAAMYQSWPQGRAAQQHSAVLALPSAQTIPSGPQMFPLIRSIYQPDHGQYLMASEQEPLSLVTGLGPFLYFSNCSMPDPVRSMSQVTIQEIEEKPQVKEDWLQGDAGSGCWKPSFLSNQSRPSPIEVPSTSIPSISHSELRIPEMMQGKDKEKIVESAAASRSSIEQGTKPIKLAEWTSPRLSNTRFKPRPPSTVQTKCQTQTPHDSSQTPLVSFPGLVRGLEPHHPAAPVRARTAGHVSKAKPRPGSLSPRAPTPQPTRISAYACSRSPCLDGMKSTGGMPSPNFVAPAVHIRSVLPVCSAPTAKKLSSPSQDTTLSGVEGKAEEPGEILAASSEFSKLRM